MIELTHVSKAYRAGHGWTRVLDDASVCFPTGVSVGIMGLNGSGKSTLLRMLGGSEPADRGRIRRTVKVSWPIGFSGGFQPTLTGRENAQFIARIYGRSTRAVIEFAADFADLGVYFDLPYRTYSSGMRARLAFGVSMAVDFDCYLVDEVLSVGDQRFQKRCQEAFQDRRTRSSIILVTHSAKRVREQCDMAAVLDAGKLTLYDTVDEAEAVYARQIQKAA